MLRSFNGLQQRLVRSAISGVYSLIYPPVCIGCEGPSYFDLDDVKGNRSHPLSPEEQEILERENWCEGCLDQIRAPLEQRCPVCGGVVQLHAALKGRCHLCQFSDFRFSQAVCINNYGGLLQSLVIKMKGQRCEVTALQLGGLLAYEIERLDQIEDVDFLTCVPTHWRKKLSKGFQASEILCQAVSKISGIASITKVLRANRPTKKQGMLSDFKRFENVKNAFSVSPIHRNKIAEKHIVLIDDVMTSGATTSQCAKVLRDAGAARVDVAVVARGAKSS